MTNPPPPEALRALVEQYRPPEHLRPAVRALSERLLVFMRDRARDMGWALAVHGSMERDLDIVAVPWAEEASDETAFVEAMRAAVASCLLGRCYVGERQGKPWPGLPFLKPHGRRSWTLYAVSEQLVESEAGAYPYIDLSVMDARPERATAYRERAEAAGRLQAAQERVRALETDNAAYRQQAINRAWNWRMVDAYGREEYARQLADEIDRTHANMLRLLTPDPEAPSSEDDPA